MAQAIMTSSKLQVRYEVRIGEGGKPIYKTKSYANVKESATADQLYPVAEALQSLSDYPLDSVKRNDISDLV